MAFLDHNKPQEGVEPDLTYLGKFFAKILTSPYDQHLIVQIEGFTGSGKSVAGLSLGMDTAKNIARINGGTWRDYYDLKKNLAVINKNEVERVMTNPGKFNILHLDDMGVGLNSRKYASEFNIWFNNIIQTFRPNNNLVIITVQNDFQIDKVVRNLCHYKVAMVTKLFEAGYTIGKVFEMKYDPIHSEKYVSYPVSLHRYVRYAFKRPSEEVIQEYKAIRQEQLSRMSEQDSKANKVGMREMATYIEGLVAEGWTIKNACKFFGFTDAAYHNYIARQGAN